MSKMLMSGSRIKQVLFVLLVFVFLGSYGLFAQMRSITGYQLVDDMKVGWNLGNSFDSLGGDETAWGNPVTTKAMIDMVAAKGFKTVRIPVSWGEHVGAGPSYTIETERLDRVQAVVDYCFANGMYAIVNMHHENAWLIPTYATEAASIVEMKAIWTQIANRFKSYSDYLVFETMNECRVEGSAEEWNGGTEENRDCINHFNQAALDAIRATGGNNALRWVMIATHAATTLDVAIKDLVIPNDTHLLISQHTYYPYTFCLQSGSPTTWGTAQEKIDMDTELDRIRNYWDLKGLPVVVGEWGSIDKDNTADRTTHAQYYSNGVRARGMLGIWWDNGWTGTEGLAILNRTTLTWHRPEIADAVVNGAAAPITSPFPGFDCSLYPVWDAATQYPDAGTKVSYNGNLYENKWFSYDQNPEEYAVNPYAVWTYLGPCSSALTPTPVSGETAAPTDVPSTPAPTAEPTTPPAETTAPTDVPATPAPTDAPTNVPAATDTPAPTAIPTATPVGVTADPTMAATESPTTPPAVTPDPTTPPAETTAPGTCTCTNLCTSTTAITVPFTKDGSGEYCYTSSSLGSYVNSWNTEAVNVNGTNCTNTYVSSSSIAAINGVYYIYYKASVSWSHIEIK